MSCRRASAISTVMGAEAEPTRRREESADGQVHGDHGGAPPAQPRGGPVDGAEGVVTSFYQ